MLTVAKVIQMVQTTKGASPTATETQTLPPFSESLLKFKTTSDASFECAPGTHAASCRELSTLSLAGRAGRPAGRQAGRQSQNKEYYQTLSRKIQEDSPEEAASEMGWGECLGAPQAKGRAGKCTDCWAWPPSRASAYTVLSTPHVSTWRSLPHIPSPDYPQSEPYSSSSAQQKCHLLHAATLEVPHHVCFPFPSTPNAYLPTSVALPHVPTQRQQKAAKSDSGQN